MVTNAEQLREMALAAVPTVVKNMGQMAIGPKTSATNRLKATELLLRVARSKHASARDARAALSKAVPALRKVAATHNSVGICAKANRLIAAIAALRM